MTLLIATLCFFNSAKSQSHPVEWNFDWKLISPGVIQLHINAAIAPGWHLYSQFMSANGPMPTRIVFGDSKDIVRIGATDESGDAFRFYDSIYEMNISWYSGKALFLQRIYMNAPRASIQGVIEYMACNDHTCIPARRAFTVDVDVQKKSP